MKVYRVEWVDKVTKYVKIEANSEEEALKKFKNEEGFDWRETQESDCEYFEEAWAEED
jgi:hypothetical protein